MGGVEEEAMREDWCCLAAEGRLAKFLQTWNFLFMRGFSSTYCFLLSGKFNFWHSHFENWTKKKIFELTILVKATFETPVHFLYTHITYTLMKHRNLVMFLSRTFHNLLDAYRESKRLLHSFLIRGLQYLDWWLCRNRGIRSFWFLSEWLIFKLLWVKWH